MDYKFKHVGRLQKLDDISSVGYMIWIANEDTGLVVRTLRCDRSNQSSDPGHSRVFNLQPQSNKVNITALEHILVLLFLYTL